MPEVYKNEEEKQAELRKELAKEHAGDIERAIIIESPLSPVEAQSFPDPEALTSSERIAFINKYRDMVQNQEDVSEVELRHAVSLIASERKMNVNAKPKKKEAAPEVAPGSSLGAF